MSIDALNWAKRQQTGHPARKLMLMTLAEYAGPDWECYPSDEVLAAICECTTRAIQNQRRRLIDDGFIIAERRRGRGGQFVNYRYRLAPPEDFSFGDDSQRKVATPPPEPPSGGPPETRRTTTGNSAHPYKDEPLPGTTTFDSTQLSAREAVDRCYAAAGPGLADRTKCPSLTTTAMEIGRWLKAGADLDEDIIPVIEAHTADPRGSPITSWKYFTAAVREHAAARLAEISQIQPEEARKPRHAKAPPVDTQAWLANRRAQRAAAEPVGGRGRGNGG